MPSVGKYHLANKDKERRARVRAGKDATDTQVVAQYDRLGGAVFDSEGKKVARGTFWDFSEGKAKEVKKEARITKEVKKAPAKKQLKNRKIK